MVQLRQPKRHPNRPEKLSFPPLGSLKGTSSNRALAAAMAAASNGGENPLGWSLRWNVSMIHPWRKPPQALQNFIALPTWHQLTLSPQIAPPTPAYRDLRFSAPKKTRSSFYQLRGASMAALWSPLEASSRRRISKGTARRREFDVVISLASLLVLGGTQKNTGCWRCDLFQTMMLSHGREIPLNPMKKMWSTFSPIFWEHMTYIKDLGKKIPPTVFSGGKFTKSESVTLFHVKKVSWKTKKSLGFCQKYGSAKFLGIFFSIWQRFEELNTCLVWRDSTARAVTFRTLFLGPSH